jgi:prolyl-tRNA synthetase
VVTVVRPDDAQTLAVAEELYEGLRVERVEVIIDDRPERPGVKFADAELIGIPLRITVGPRGVDSGTAELFDRRSGAKSELPLDEVVATVTALVGEGRNPL